MKNPRQSIACLVLILASFISIKAHAELEWAKGEGLPSDWTPLENNLLAGQIGTLSGAFAGGDYSTKDSRLLTDAAVPSVGGKDWIVGFQNNASVTWTFTAPKTLDCLRLSCGYLAQTGYSGFTVQSVEVQAFGSSDWVQINTSAGQKTDDKQSKILSLMLSDTSGEPLARRVGALRVTFGTPPTGFANYCAEIEAVGSSEIDLASLEITPVKTKANVNGFLADAGTGGTACDIYLSINSAKSVRIAKQTMGAFAYQIKGLTAGTTYSYELCVSNNASSVAGISRTGQFTTLAADAQTASWTQSEFAVGSWSPLEKNILGGLAAMVMSGESEYASSDSLVLTDGVVPFSKLQSDGEAGAMTVGFKPNGTIAWEFNKPTSIEKIRLSSYWWTMQYNGISVNSIWVKFKDMDGWQALDVPAVEWKGGTEFVQTMTLTDAEYGFIAKNIVGLKIVFGPQKAAVANYYAEIEAIGREITPGFMMLMR